MSAKYVARIVRAVTLASRHVVKAFFHKTPVEKTPP